MQGQAQGQAARDCPEQQRRPLRCGGQGAAQQLDAWHLGAQVDLPGFEDAERQPGLWCRQGRVGGLRWSVGHRKRFGQPAPCLQGGAAGVAHCVQELARLWLLSRAEGLGVQLQRPERQVLGAGLERLGGLQLQLLGPLQLLLRAGQTLGSPAWQGLEAVPAWRQTRAAL